MDVVDGVDLFVVHWCSFRGARRALFDRLSPYDPQGGVRGGQAVEI